MLHNQKIRDVIDTITSKAVLILGRFTPERKAVLDALREELRRATIFRSCLISISQPIGTSRKPFHCWHAWRASLWRTSQMLRPSHRNSMSSCQICRPFPCNLSC